MRVPLPWICCCSDDEFSVWNRISSLKRIYSVRIRWHKRFSGIRQDTHINAPTRMLSNICTETMQGWGFEGGNWVGWFYYYILRRMLTHSHKIGITMAVLLFCWCLPLRLVALIIDEWNYSKVKTLLVSSVEEVGRKVSQPTDERSEGFVPAHRYGFWMFAAFSGCVSRNI